MPDQMPEPKTFNPLPPIDTRRITGAVRKLKFDKGYGFIAGDDGLDYFFHWSAMEMTSKNFKELLVQMRVEFSPCAVTEEKRRAVQVRVLADGEKNPSS